VTEIRVPKPAAGTKSAFLKYALRKSIDFPIVNCAVMVTASKGKVDAARICLNAVYVKPYRAIKAEEAIVGKGLNEANAEAAGEAAVAVATPRADNAYMVQVAKVMVKRALLACK
jgi:xanthine dehydrogenase YagS FAD-binding subunit